MKIDPLDKNLVGDRVTEFTFHLSHDRLFAPDHLRDVPSLLRQLKAAFAEKESVLFGIFNDDAMVGVFGLTNVVKGHDAQFRLWLWGKGGLTIGLVKNIRNFLTYMKDLYGLKRVTAQTADEDHLRLLGLIGFKVEGRFRAGFKWDGKYFQLYQLRVIGEV